MYSTVLYALQRQGVIRSYNNPVGDVAEWMVSKHLKLTLMPPSWKHFDATDASGGRYQIKARRLWGKNRSSQFTVRGIEATPFDYLACVIFEGDFFVRRAAVVPMELLRLICKPTNDPNVQRFNFSRDVITLPGVFDISVLLSTLPLTESEERLVARLRAVRLPQSK
ncbi:hypothetical protein [Ralstonia mojiangensis]|uniref:hypothetical protein n=1 Tax=Ralstonia mojiangensis TaxID=2953895 RepID=UPI00209043CE|nr:hypothetical protein [Ralstonia mojiangensis]MCO5413500.1 hypothetical protein [Ralstonia mojiangensis]